MVPGLSAAASTPVTPTVTLGTPVTIVSGTRTVAAIPVTNTGDRHVTFTLRAPLKPGGKALTAPQSGVSMIPPDTTWTVTLIAGDEVIAANYDLLNPEITGYFVVPQTVDPSIAQKIQVGKPSVAIEGKRATANVEVKNTNDHRVSFRLLVLLRKDGAVVGFAQWPETLEPGQSRTLSLPVEGVAEGTEAEVQVSNIGRP